MQVHRFGDTIAISPPKGDTFYLTAEEAITLGRLLVRAGESVNRTYFPGSTFAATPLSIPFRDSGAAAQVKIKRGAQ